MIDPLFDLTGKVALVTGGSRGLGYQMVRAFAERGADVIIASRKLDNCEVVANEVRALGRRALAVQVHAAKWSSIDQLIDVAYAEFGHVDILVNNAGMSPRDAEPRGHRGAVRQRHGSELQGSLPPGLAGRASGCATEEAG